MWPQYNRRLRKVVAPVTEEELANRPPPELWLIWATVGHTAGVRVYWLCDVIGEPGAETTPAENREYGGGMREARIGPAYSNWPRYNQALRDAVESLTDEQLAMKSSPERWPLWATASLRQVDLWD